ncbi:MAG: DPP IV N-terminal domain-containing protein [Bryobacteraceae bacterium]
MSRSVPVPGFRFGAFEVSLQAGELYKHGVRISLQEQPFRVLITLLERAGEVVLRDEFRQRLWPDGTFVDFDRGLNTAINRLREALGDTSGNPRFIETVPRRGYRFIAEVQDLRLAGGAARAEEVRRWSPGNIWSPTTLFLLPVILTLFAGVWYAARPNRSAEVRMQGVQLTSYPGNEREPTFSPDGSQVAFAWDADQAGRSQIYVKQVHGQRLLRLTSSAADDRNPVWSPNGRWIAFLRTDDPDTVNIVLIPALGGQERKIAEVAAPWTASTAELRPPIGHLAWSPDSKSLIITDRSAGSIGLSLVSVETGAKRRLTAPSAEWYGDFSPAFSPDGAKLAFIRAPSMSVSGLYVIPLDENLAPTGPPERLPTQNCWIANPVWVQDDELAYSCGQWGAGRRLFRIATSEGSKPRLAGSLGEDVYFLSISHSARRLAYSREEMDWDIWRVEVADLQRSRAATGGEKTPVQFLSSTRVESNPQYSPDGTKLAFESSRSGNSQLWISEADGSNAFQLTSVDAPVNGFPRWSPDGRQIVFHSRPRGQADIFVIDSTGGVPRQLTDHSSDEIMPSWSRDGRWIYYSSRQSGEFEVWRIPAQGGSAVRMTYRGGYAPFECPESRFLWYTKELSKGGAGASLWKTPITGGQEALVIDSLANPSTYAVTEDGIYFIGHDRSGPGMSIQFVDPKTGRYARLASIEQAPALGLAISPDGWWALYNTMDERKSDLMLVEDFR